MGLGAPFQKLFCLLKCFYFPLVYHQDISPFHGDFLIRSHSHFRKLSSCWMTIITSFLFGNQKQLLSALCRKRGLVHLVGQGKRESPTSCDDAETGKISSIEVTIRQSSTRALVGQGASSVTGPGLIGKEFQNTLEHPINTTFPVHFQNAYTR